MHYHIMDGGVNVRFFSMANGRFSLFVYEVVVKGWCQMMDYTFFWVSI